MPGHEDSIRVPLNSPRRRHNAGGGRSISLVFALGVAFASIGRADPPTTTRAANVDEYLDVCVAAIEQWPQAPGGLPSVHDVARSLVYARGNDRDRAAARRLVDVEQPAAAGANRQSHASGQQFSKLALRAALGEREALVPEIERLLASRSAPGNVEVGPLPTMLTIPELPATTEAAILFALAGQDERCDPLLADGGTASVALALAEAGESARVDQLLRRLRPAGAGVFSHLRAADLLAARGRIDEAIASFGTEEPERRAASLVRFAFRSRQIGLPRVPTRALRRALIAEAAMPVEVQSELKSEFGWDLWTSDDVLARILWTRLQVLFPAGAKLTSRQATMIGRFALKFGSRERFDDAFAAARSLRRLDQDGHAELAVAVLLAIDGRAAEAVAEFEARHAGSPHERLEYSGGFQDFLAALAENGEAERCVALIDKHLPESFDRDEGYAKTVAACARRGDIDRAWDVAARMDDAKLRASTRLGVLLELERAGHRDEALVRLASIDEPAERARIAVNVARDLLGTRALGHGEVALFP